jgi:hypothetical protein
MRVPRYVSLVLLLALASFADAKKPDHEWSVGKILDESQARFYAGTINNSSSSSCSWHSASWPSFEDWS